MNGRAFDVIARRISIKFSAGEARKFRFQLLVDRPKNRIAIDQYSKLRVNILVEWAFIDAVPINPFDCLQLINTISLISFI